MVKRYCKKPVVVEAVEWTGRNMTEIREFCGSDAIFGECGHIVMDHPFPIRVAVDVPPLYIHTLEGDMRASVGDYIIRGVGGEFYPCKPDIFEQTYEEVE